MAIKVYKEGYMVVIDDSTKQDQLHKTSSDEKQNFLATTCRHGFDGDICWIKEEIGATHIYKDNVDQMQDSAGTPIGDKAAVDAYLLAFLGDGSDTASPTV